MADSAAQAPGHPPADLVVAMFAFGFALVPIYDVMCKAFGINGKTAGQYEGEQVVDPSRQVRVQFCRPTTSTCLGVLFQGR
jgi:cytochrome c oxidase assembly protein Cox11